MTPEDLAGWLAEKNPPFRYKPDTAKGNIFIGETPKDTVPSVGVSLSDMGAEYSVCGGTELSSYGLYDADIRIEAGGSAQGAYILGRQFLQSLMKAKGARIGDVTVAGCGLRAPVAVKRAADGIFTAAFSVRLTAAKQHV